MDDRRKLTRFAWLSVGAAVATIGLKTGAYLLTGSVGLLSDAIESTANLIAALVALIALTIAALPPDEEHAYGHAKAEYFASGVEGTLILAAAIAVALSGIQRLINPAELERLGAGITISVLAALLNLGVARILKKAGAYHRSITLEADAQHLMTDVWTTVGVLFGVAAASITGWQPLDALVAIAVSIHILFSGGKLVRRSVLGLMDTALPPDEVATIEQILERCTRSGVMYHALRTRQSGSLRFVSVHVQVPGAWTVQEGHGLLEEIEKELRKAISPISVFTHLEPLEDPVSWEDISINRAPD